MIITKQTVTEAWKAAMAYLLRDGSNYTDSNNRQMKEALNLIVEIKEPAKEIEKPIEIMRRSDQWVYPSPDEIEAGVLSKKHSSAFTYSYGSRIFDFEGVNQIDDFIVPLLRKDPNTRRAVVVLWNPKQDSNIYNKHFPGFVLIDLKLRDNKLHATTYIRSSDIFFGWPANTYQIYILLKYISEKIKSEIGTITIISSSAHIFHEDIESIKSVLHKKD